MQSALNSHDPLAHNAATVEGECAKLGIDVHAFLRAAYGRYGVDIKSRDRGRMTEFLRAALCEYAADVIGGRLPTAPRPVVSPLVTSCLESLARIKQSADHAVGEARAALVRAFEILAAFLLFLLGAPLPAVTAPGISAAVPPLPALGIPASHVAMLVAAGPISA